MAKAAALAPFADITAVANQPDLVIGLPSLLSASIITAQPALSSKALPMTRAKLQRLVEPGAIPDGHLNLLPLCYEPDIQNSLSI